MPVRKARRQASAKLSHREGEEGKEEECERCMMTTTSMCARATIGKRRREEKGMTSGAYTSMSRKRGIAEGNIIHTEIPIQSRTPTGGSKSNPTVNRDVFQRIIIVCFKIGKQ